MTNIDKLSDNPHVIFVGGKPFMNYVTAVVMQFTVKGADKVVIKSRGKFISRAVDIAEVVKNRFLKDQVKVSDIEIDSEGFKNNEGQQVTVSTLDISLGKVEDKPITSQIDVKHQKSSNPSGIAPTSKDTDNNLAELQTEEGHGEVEFSFDKNPSAPQVE